MRNKRIVAIFSLLFLLINYYGSIPVYADTLDPDKVAQESKKALVAEIVTCMESCSSDLMNVYDKKSFVDKVVSMGDFLGDSAKGDYKVVSTTVNGVTKFSLALTSWGLDSLKKVIFGIDSDSIIYCGGGSYLVSVTLKSGVNFKTVYTATKKVQVAYRTLQDGKIVGGQTTYKTINPGDSVVIKTQGMDTWSSALIGACTPGSDAVPGAYASSTGTTNAECVFDGVSYTFKDAVNTSKANSYNFSNTSSGFSDYGIPINSDGSPVDSDVLDKVLPASGKTSDLPSDYKTDNYKDTGNTGGDTSFSLPNVLGSIVDLFKALLDAVNSILHFFTIDFTKVSSHMNYGDVMKSHFSPVFDVFNLFSNVHVDSSTSSSDAGKFYMKIPKAMGGDDQEHCVLDLTVGAVYVNKAREIIKYGIWIYFLWYLFRNFSPKFNVGG